MSKEAAIEDLNINMVWDKVQGFSSQKELLQRSVEQQKIHHALLLSGLAGVGKKMLAQAFAAALNCENRPDGVWKGACLHCRSCQMLQKGGNPDYLEVKPTGRFILISQVREIVAYCRTRPYESRYKIVLLESADRMNREAANALLKTLEEPQAQVLLMLLTERPDSLLETILSRCQHLRFGSMSTDVVAAIAQQNVPDDTPNDTIQVAARLAAGSPGRAIEILNTKILDQRADLFHAISQLTPKRTLLRFDLAQTLIAGGRKELEPRLDLLRSFFRDLSIFGATKQPNRLIHLDFLDSMTKMSGWLPPLDAARCAEQINQALQLIDQNVQPQLVVENLLEFIGNYNQI